MLQPAREDGCRDLRATDTDCPTRQVHPQTACMSYEEEDTCMSYEEEDTCTDCPSRQVHPQTAQTHTLQSRKTLHSRIAFSLQTFSAKAAPCDPPHYKSIVSDPLYPSPAPSPSISPPSPSRSKTKKCQSNVMPVPQTSTPQTSTPQTSTCGRTRRLVPSGVRCATDPRLDT